MRQKIIAIGLSTVGVAVMVIAPFIGFAQENPPSGSLTQCDTGISLTKPLNGQVLSGAFPLEVSAVNTSSVQYVQFMIGDTVAGVGQRDGTIWRFILDTQQFPSGGKTIYARVNYIRPDSSSAYCRTNTVSVTFQNSTQPPVGQLQLYANPPSWTGPTNVNLGFSIQALFVYNGQTQDKTTVTSYTWSTNKGSLNPDGNHSNFNSGPSTGSGEITVVGSFNGQVAEVRIPLQITSTAQSPSYPSTTNPDGSVNLPPQTEIDQALGSNPDGTSDTSTANPTQDRRQGDSELEACLIVVLGQENYRQIVESSQRIPFQDLPKTAPCFARRNNVIPANLAPINPDKVRDLRIDAARARINKIDESIQNGKKVLLLSGYATPNADVVIYVFSEPLVLTAKAASSGQWNYTLEDPLEPGDHEVYATVAGDEAEPVRSAGLGFALASVPKTSENPLGLSLTIRGGSQPKVLFAVYLAGAIGLVVAALLITLFLVRKRRHPLIKPPTNAPSHVS